MTSAFATKPTRDGASTAPAKSPSSSRPAASSTPSFYFASAAPALTLGPAAASYVRSPGPGASLAPDVRSRIEGSFGADVSSLRVHSGGRAATVADGLGARAFTYGPNVFLGSGQAASNVGLMAHEAAHVVQQSPGGAGGRVAASLEGSAPGSTTAYAADPLEAQARHASAAVLGGRPAALPGRAAAPAVQRDAAPEPGFLERQMWSLLEGVDPDLARILRRGVVEWLKEQISSAIQSITDRMMAPVREVGAVVGVLVAHFNSLVAWVQDAAARIAKGDCSALSEAADKIEKVFEGLASPVIERVKHVAARVGEFFGGLWDRFGAPVWDFLKKVGGAAWERIQQFAAWVWDKTKPIRDWLSAAWTRFKNFLGVGEGPEGQDGLLQWVQRKAGDAWDWLKVRIEPIKKPLMVVGGILVLLSPAGPVLLIGGAVVGLMQGFRWLRQNLRNKDAIIRQRGYVQGVIIPGIMAAARGVTAALQRAADSIVSKLNEVVAGLTGAAGAAAGSVLSFLAAAVRWVAGLFQGLVNWGAGQLVGLVGWIASALDRVGAFLQPILKLLGEVGNVIVDVMQLPMMLAGKVWNIVPACIRDPIVDFVVPIILRQIPIFQELGRDNEAWQRTKADVMRIIRLVFRDRDLVGAIKAVFHLLLRAFNVPVDLAIQVAKKAAAAWDVVLERPVAFIKNAVRAIGNGFLRFGKRILHHLGFGVEGWLLGSLADQGIKAPNSWLNPMDVFGFALDVLGLSVNHVFELLKKRFPNGVDKLRKWYDRIASAWAWVREIIDTSKSPAESTRAIMDRAKDMGMAVLTGVVEWIAARVAAEIAVLAAAAAASAGISQAIDTVRRIYIAIQSAVRWMNRILQMVNRVLDSVMNIAMGVIEPAGEALEAAMHQAMPVVIGFLADQVGLGGVGDKVRDLIAKLRAKVDDAILWLIDKATSLFNAIISGAKGAVASVLEWWKRRMRVGKGANAHTLSFDGDEDSAELYIESRKTRLSLYIAALRPRPEYAAPPKVKNMDEVDKKIDVIRTLRGERRKATAAGKEAEAEKKRKDISDGFDAIGGQLGELFAGDQYGTESDPIPLHWPGPSIHNYPVLLFGGKLPADKRPRSQVAMRAIKNSGKNDETGTPILEYHATSPKALPGGQTIGISPSYFVDVGTVVGPLSRDTTPGGDKLLRLIQPYGFSSTDDNMQLDHVREIQLGGAATNDQVVNLWPLESSKNSRKGSVISRAPVEYPKGQPTTIATLKLIDNDDVQAKKKFFFKIKSME